MTKCKNDDYITLANKRYKDNKQAKQDKNKLERDKFNGNKKKDIKNGLIAVLISIPLIILLITFVIIWVKLLINK